MVDYLIVGAGFAGSVIAERIAAVLNKKVLIIEKKNHAGGHCHDFRDKNRIIIHKYGPHLFHTDDKNVFDYLSDFTEWHNYQHKVLAFIDGVKVPLPFNFNSMELLFKKELSDKMQKKLLAKYSQNKKIPILELKKSDDEDLKYLAQFVYDKIFKNYTAKQWEMKPEDLDPEVTARVPVFTGRDNRYFNDAYQAVPEEGYSKIFEKMVKNKNIKLKLNTDAKKILKIDHENKKIYLSGKEFKGKIIYTGMIDELFDYKFGELPYRSLKLQFETLKLDFYQEGAVVNYPNDYDFTRITEFKHIHPVNSGKTVILKEYPLKYDKNKNDPYYPVFTEEIRNNYDRYFEYSKDFKNLILLGRLAEYKYYDMDDIVKRALEIFEEKIR